MNEHKPVFISTTPVLASLDMARTVAFYARVLGARTVHAQPGEYAIVSLGGLELHFWACQDPEIPRQTSCRIQVAGIAALHAQCLAENAVHPNGGLRQQPCGQSIHFPVKFTKTQTSFFMNRNNGLRIWMFFSDYAKGRSNCFMAKRPI